MGLEMENEVGISHLFYNRMYNEHFQYGQRINTSGYWSDSVLKPSPFRLEPPRAPADPSPSPTTNLIIQKIEALFPILEDMAGQNDLRANTIIDRLMGLRETLDSAYGEAEQELGQTENENASLKNRLKTVKREKRTVVVEDTEALRKL